MSDLKVNIIKHPLIQHKLTLMRKTKAKVQAICKKFPLYEE